jgi:hypothetical protein
MMAQDWCFISSNQDGKAPKDPDSRKLIRANAMKAFRRTQRQERMKTFKKKEPGPSRRKAAAVQDLVVSKSASKTVAVPESSPLVVPEPSKSAELSIVGWNTPKHSPKLDDVKVSFDFARPQSFLPYAGLGTQCDPFAATALDGHGGSELFKHCTCPL